MSTQISAETLSTITHQNVPVITTELLAQLYGTTAHSITKNHRSNVDRFIAGKHYFKVVGQELATLRVTFGDLQISSKARSLILWTERGAARHAKMLETDQAWEVFEKLEDCYFAVKSATDSMEPIVAPSLTLNGIFAYYFENNRIIRVEAVPDNYIIGSLAIFEDMVRRKGGVVLWGDEQCRGFVKDNLMKLLA